MAGDDITSYAADESAIDGYFIPNVIYARRSNEPTSSDYTKLDLLVIDVRGKLAQGSDLALGTMQTPVQAIDLTGKTITVANGTDLTTDLSTAIKGSLTGVLSIEKTANDKYTVVSTNGTSYVFTVTVAPAPAVGN